jgi:HAD superfamily hydrolase (TIGR01509 family)
VDVTRAIGFDLDHTLAIDNKLERVALLRLLELLLAEGGRPVGTLADEIASIDALLHAQRCGEFSIDDAVRRFVAERHVEPAESHVEWFRCRAIEMVPELVVPLPGVGSTLEALRRRGIVMAVLTNGWNPLQRSKAQRAGFAGPVLVSSEIGMQKPAARAFELLLATLGADPGESWYVGDDPRGDVAGAHAIGMQTVWIDWEAKEYPPDVPAPTHTIRDFGKLLEIFAVPVRAT